MPKLIPMQPLRLSLLHPLWLRQNAAYAVLILGIFFLPLLHPLRTATKTRHVKIPVIKLSAFRKTDVAYNALF